MQRCSPNTRSQNAKWVSKKKTKKLTVESCFTRNKVNCLTWEKISTRWFWSLRTLSILDKSSNFPHAFFNAVISYIPFLAIGASCWNKWIWNGYKITAAKRKLFISAKTASFFPFLFCPPPLTKVRAISGVRLAHGKTFQSFSTISPTPLLKINTYFGGAAYLLCSWEKVRVIAAFSEIHHYVHQRCLMWRSFHIQRLEVSR